MVKCIFCQTDFVPDTNGEGEHVVPQNIFGFWKIDDVCPKCMLIFGNSVDQLPLKNIEILNILDKLPLKDTTPYYENIPFVGLDSQSRSPLSMVFHKDSLRVKVVKSPSFIRTDEAHFEIIAKPWLKAVLAGKLSEAALETEFQRMLDEYAKLPIGGVYNSPTFGYSIQRGQVIPKGVDNDAMPPISRLIAKIVVCCARYMIPEGQQCQLTDLKLFVNHAIKGEELPEQRLFPLETPDDGPYRFHSLAASVHDRLLYIDVFLFGVVCWRAIFPTEHPIQLLDEADNPVVALQFILDFTDTAKPSYGFGFQSSEDGEFRHIRIDPIYEGSHECP